MGRVALNGTRIHYVQVPCESGDDCEHLVMVHGLATNLAFWYLRYASAFSNRFRITLYDLRGHGRSERSHSGYTPINMAADLQALLDHLRIERAHFAAHSFGGVVALRLASVDPNRFASLVLLDTHLSAARRRPVTQEWEFGKKIQKVLDQHGIDLDVEDPYFGYQLLSAIAQLQIRQQVIPTALKDLVRPLLGQNGQHTTRQWLGLMETTRAPSELMRDDGLSWDILQEFKFPILAMYGENSHALSTGNHLLQIWPHADFRRIRKAGHFFPLTRPDELVQICQTFWNGTGRMKPRRREGDGTQRYFRSNRYYRRGGKWFLDTRETKADGPFADIHAAREYLGQQHLAPRGMGEVGP